VAVATLDATSGKIQTLRLHWDQGTVLRQIGVLPDSLFCRANSSETVLPVLGPKVVDRVLSSAAAASASNGSTPAAATAAPSSTSAGAGAPLNGVRPSSRVLQRPGGNTHDIFGTESAAAATAQRPSSRVLARPGGPVSDVFAPSPASTPAASPAVPSAELSSALPSGTAAAVGDAAEVESVASNESMVTSASGRRVPRGGAASAMASSIVFGDDGGSAAGDRPSAGRGSLGGIRDPNATSGSATQRPSSR
ncbi:hypothetical protein HK405_002452, partial [Cladochytrium tenue]